MCPVLCLQKVERLRGALHFIGAPAQARHTVFVDDEAEAAAFRPDAYFDTPAELLGRAFNRPRRLAFLLCLWDKAHHLAVKRPF